MQKIDKHIEIVSSTTVGLSSMSQVSREAAQAVLLRHYTSVVITIINNKVDLEDLVRRKPDLVFLGMKYIPANHLLGRDDPHKIWLTDYLDEHGITYTGSTQTAHELELNKELAKQQVAKAGLRTSPFLLVKQGKEPTLAGTGLTYPLFVKPANRGGGQGIDESSLVSNDAELLSKVTALSTGLGADALLEKYLPGREFSVAILKRESGMGYNVMPIELATDSGENAPAVLSAEVKQSNAEVVTGVTDIATRRAVCTLALGVFEALGARDYGRIDIRMDGNGVPHFLEANLLPSLITNYGSFPKASVLNKGINYESMLLLIVNLAFCRDNDDSEPILGVIYDSVLPIAQAITL